MKDFEKTPTGLLKDTADLRSLILKHPDLPIVVCAGDDCNTGDYSYMLCNYVNVQLGEVLDCRQDVNDERVYFDRDEFEEDLANSIDTECTGAEFEKLVSDRLSEYAPYWKPSCGRSQSGSEVFHRSPRKEMCYPRFMYGCPGCK